MAKQLTVTFLVLVVLTQQSFSASYQPLDPAGQTGNPEENQDTVNKNTATEGEQGESEQSVQTTQENNVADQNKEKTTSGTTQDYQKSDRIHPSGWGYGEAEDAGIQHPGQAYGQDQNKDTTTDRKEQDSQKSDRIYFPDDSEDENAGVQNKGQAYGQNRNGDTKTDEKGDDSQQSDKTGEENGGGYVTTSGTNGDTQQSSGADEKNDVDDQSNTNSQDQNEDTTIDWNQVYIPQWSNTNKLIHSIYGQHQDELQDGVGDTAMNEEKNDFKQSDGNEEENGVEYATPNGKQDNTQQSDNTQQANAGGYATTSGTNDVTQQSGGADEDNGDGGYSSTYDQDQDADTTRVEGQEDSKFPDQTQLSGSSYGQGQSEQQNPSGYQGSVNSQDGDQDSNGYEGQNNVEHDNSWGNKVNAIDWNQTTDQQGDVVEVSVQAIQKETLIGAKNVEVAAGRKNTLVVQSDGQNVTLEFSSTEFAIVFFDNVFLLENTELVTINGMFSEMANQLKTSGSKGFYHVIPAS